MTDWIRVLFLFFINTGLIIWFRSHTEANRRESRDDWRHMDAKLDAFMKIINAEMKDFHGRLEHQDAEFKIRLCSIEERHLRGGK